MNAFHTKKLTVKAVRFEQHRKPWPEAVEAVHTNGIPEPRLEGGNVPVRNGDYVVAVGPVLFTLPPAIFSRLFVEGEAEGDSLLAKALEEIVALETRLNELLRDKEPEPSVELHPDNFDVLPGTGDVNPNE